MGSAELDTKALRVGKWCSFFLVASSFLLAIGGVGVRRCEGGEIPFAAKYRIGGADCYSVFPIDLDRDGDMDVVSADGANDTVSWFENLGTGEWWIERNIYTAANGVVSVWAADLNRDGLIDVLSASKYDDAIRWYRNIGGSPPGFYATPYVLTTAADGAQAVCARDMDRDGDVDVISCSYNDDEISWYENNGAAIPGFTKHLIVMYISPLPSVADGVRSVYPADVNGDGAIDIVWGSYLNDTIGWLRSDGASDPSFTPVVIDNVSADGPTDVIVADVDVDGDMDVLSASSVDDSIYYFRNVNGDGATWWDYPVTESADDVRAVFAADVSGDGYIDVLSASAADDRITWYENDEGVLTFATARTISTLADGPRDVAVADIDGDGDLDVVSGSADDDDVAWYENESIHRNAVFPWESEIDSTPDGVNSLCLGDMSGDGDTDILCTSLFEGSVECYESHRLGYPPFGIFGLYFDASLPQQVYAADMDDDGDLDFVVSSWADDKVAWAQIHGASSIHFSLDYYTVSIGVQDGPTGVCAADLTGDGRAEVVACSSEDDKVVWYKNNGAATPTFTPYTITSSLDYPLAVQCADVDRDGAQDIIAAGKNDDTIMWFENNGGSTPSWTGHDISYGADEPRSLYIADMNGDGKPDVVSASSGDNKIAWYDNNGTSLWPGYVITTDALDARWVYAADVDLDGDMDVLSASHDDDKIAWYESDGAAVPSFTPHVVSVNVDGATAVCAGDIDMDGDVDIVSASSYDDVVMRYRNAGGQCTLDCEWTAPRTMYEGAAPGVLKISVTHNGRPEDNDLELTQIVIDFQYLTEAEANALIRDIKVFRDTGSGDYEFLWDEWVTTVSTLSWTSGAQYIALPAGSDTVRISPGGTETYFVVLNTDMNAASESEDEFYIVHVAASYGDQTQTTHAIDRDYGIPLMKEYVDTTSSSCIKILANHGLTPRNATVSVGEYLNFVASAGDGTWSTVSAPSGATIDSVTGLYQAGGTGGETDEVALDIGSEQDRTNVTVTTSPRANGVVGPPTSMDLDGGGVGISDVVLMLRCVVGLDTPTAQQRSAGDFNWNGSIDIGDVVNALRVVVGLAPTA